MCCADEGPASFDTVFTDCLLSLCVSDARASQHIKFDSVRTVFSHKEEEEQALCVCERAKHVRSILPALKT